MYSSFMRFIQSSPSRGPALTVSIGSFCTVALVASSTMLANEERERPPGRPGLPSGPSKARTPRPRADTRGAG